MTDERLYLIATTKEIAAAYVSRNHVAASNLPTLLASIHAALTALTSKSLWIEPEPADELKLTPSQIRKSITPDALISFIDGKRYKTLKRHIGKHGLDPMSYRQRYGLPHDYPTVAPSYSERRAALAKGRDFRRRSKDRSKTAD